MWTKDDGRAPGTRYSAEQKAEFFVLLDRLGSVSAAARQLGINTQTAFSWSYSLTALERKPQGKPTARQLALAPKKAEFLAVLERAGNISVAARETGVKRSQGESWARAAGVENILQSRAEKQAEYTRLREVGATQKAASAIVGVNRRTGYDWDQAARAAKAHADADQSADTAYTCEVPTALAEPDSLLKTAAEPFEAPGLTLMPELPTGCQETLAPPIAAAPSAGPSEAPALPVVPAPRTVTIEHLEQSIDPRYLAQQEREMIADMLRAGKSIRTIGRQLGRSASSISREIQRNSHPRLGYQPHGAQRAATKARARPKPSKLAADGELRDYVEDKLRIRWSPEQISNALIKEFPDDPNMRVSHETIYQALYLQARGGLKREVQHALRTGRTRRKKHQNPEERTSRFRDPMINISERPAEVEDRAVPGHWEGDLITGAHNQSAIATLVERTTRYVMLVHLPGNHTAETVRDGLIETMGSLPAHLRGSLTWDQGVEMAKHKAFSIATDMDVYFCDPHSPWQRGSNENTNGLLRQYFPKGTDLNAYGPEDLEHVAQELNARPRKTLGWNTPAEQLRDLLIAS
jgi:IS30 family transposase/molybdenum-dependent DNA-binding transcriptional regulator ModE